MSFNKRMVRNAVIGIVALVILGVGYFFAVKWQPESEESGQSSYESVFVLSIEEQKVSKIVYKNGNESFSVVRTGEGDKQKWIIPECESTEFVQNKLQSGVYSLTAISAIKELGDKSESLTEFGLDREDKTATVYTEDSEITLILGDKVVVDESYYLMKKGENKVYTVSGYVADAILKTPNDFRETVLAEINTTDITGIAIKHGNERFMEFKGNSSKKANGLQMAALSMTYPYDEDVRVEPFTNMISAFNGVEVIDFVSENMADAVKYGLDKGWSIEISTADKAHHIRFGNSDETGNLYATYNDCGYIFTMSAAMQEAFKDIKPFDMIDKMAHIYMINDIKSVVIKLGGSTHTMSIEGTEDNSEYKIDGKAATEDAFKGMYQIIIGRAITDIVKDQALIGKEVAELTFNMRDGKIHTAKYYEYDDRSLVVQRPDGKRYLMLKKYIDEMQEKLEAFCKEPTVKPRTDY